MARLELFGRYTSILQQATQMALDEASRIPLQPNQLVGCKLDGKVFHLREIFGDRALVSSIDENGDLTSPVEIPVEGLFSMNRSQEFFQSLGGLRALMGPYN